MLHTFEQRMKECATIIEELDRYLNTNKTSHNLKMLPSIFQNQRDFLVALDIKIHQLDDYMGLLRDKYIQLRKRLGKDINPFEREKKKKLASEFAATYSAQAIGGVNPSTPNPPPGVFGGFGATGAGTTSDCGGLSGVAGGTGGTGGLGGAE